MPYSPHKQCVPSEEIPIFFFGKELIIYLMHASRRILKDLQIKQKGNKVDAESFYPD